MRSGIFALMVLMMFSLCSCKQTECSMKRAKCNYECGDGLVGSLCKDGCTLKYHYCKRKKRR